MSSQKRSSRVLQLSTHFWTPSRPKTPSQGRNRLGTNYWVPWPCWPQCRPQLAAWASSECVSGPQRAKKKADKAYFCWSLVFFPGASKFASWEFGEFKAVFSKSPGGAPFGLSSAMKQGSAPNIRNFYVLQDEDNKRLLKVGDPQNHRFTKSWSSMNWMIFLEPPSLEGKYHKKKNSPWPKHQWSPAISGDQFRPSDVHGWGSRSELHPRSYYTWLHLLRSSPKWPIGKPT